MKKLFLLTCAILGVIYAFASGISQAAPSDVISTSEMSSSARVFYDGYAYSAAQDGLIPSADGSVSVYWSETECVVNGNAGYIPYKIDGGTFPMRINGKTKSMTHYVSYKGERYYFQI